MTTKVNPVLARYLAHIHADSTQVADDVGLFLMTSAKQAQDAARKLGLDRPPKRQPQPPVANVAQRTSPKVRPWDFSPALMVLVN
jgi:hypothetical protein